MDIDGFGRESVSELFKIGMLKSIPDVYHLNYDQVLTLEGWKEKV